MDKTHPLPVVLRCLVPDNEGPFDLLRGSRILTILLPSRWISSLLEEHDELPLWKDKCVEKNYPRAFPECATLNPLEGKVPCHQLKVGFEFGRRGRGNALGEV